MPTRACITPSIPNLYIPGDGVPKTRQQIAQMLGISRSQVSEIEAAAMAKIKAALSRNLGFDSPPHVSEPSPITKRNKRNIGIRRPR